MLDAEISRLRSREAEMARLDSLTLWRYLNVGSGLALLEDAPLHLSNPGETRALNLPGRYHVGDGNEFAGAIREISASGIGVKGPKLGRAGNWCKVNIAAVGIVEGLVVRATQHAFVVGVIAPPGRLRRLAQRLRWQFRCQNNEVIDRRASQRIDMNRANAELTTIEGRPYSCEIFDISRGGAALHMGADALYFWVDQPIRFDGRAGRVLRTFPGGVVIRFDDQEQDQASDDYDDYPLSA